MAAAAACIAARGTELDLAAITASRGSEGRWQPRRPVSARFSVVHVEGRPNIVVGFAGQRIAYQETSMKISFELVNSDLVPGRNSSRRDGTMSIAKPIGHENCCISQLVCSGCRSVLLYPRGAANVRCALCSIVTSVPPEMAQLICGGCRTLLMYTCGASSVRCSCCHTVNLAPVTPASNQYAHVNCGNCRTMLMYPYGAPSVKCALCHYITNVGVGSARVNVPSQRLDGPQSGTMPSTSTSMPQSTQTVVVENPMSVDETGKLVTNVVVGVTTEKR